MKTTMILFAIGLSLGALADGPAVSDVVVRQRWPWSRLVDIDYVLACEQAQRCDVAVAAYDGETRLILPECSLSGDLYGVPPGTRRIVWDPMATGYTNGLALKDFRVTLTPTVAPVYMIVDLTKDAGAPGQVTYVYEEDLAGGAFGTVQTNPVTGVQSVIWTGVTNSTDYMTTKLVMRRIQAGTFLMNGTQSVTLTKDFYIGVFEMTVAQVNAMTNGLPTSTKPLVSVSYNALRGAADGVPVISWPGTGYAVAPGSLIARLRTRTGFEAIDLPTFAQWEYACRAETTSYYYDGESTSDPVYTNVLKTLAWYLDNSSNTLQPVGGKWPNAWGLYDMLGNALEWQLDWYVPSMSDYASVDPVGSETGADRIRRSGSYAHDRTWARCGHYINFAPASTGPWLGFRVAVPLK